MQIGIVDRQVLTQEEHEFVFRHGLFNCFTATMKSEEEVLHVLQTEVDPGACSISRFAGRQLVCCCYPIPAFSVYTNLEKGIFVDDIFVAGDDNIAFNQNCFE